MQEQSDGNNTSSSRRTVFAFVFALLAGACGIGGFVFANRVYESHRGQDLDMPEWFVINMDLTKQLFPFMVFGGLFSAAALFIFVLNREKRPLANLLFGAVWALSTAAVLMLVWSRLPI